jgi:hypothetical protein
MAIGKEKTNDKNIRWVFIESWTEKGGWWGGIGFRCDDTAETGLNLHAHSTYYTLAPCDSFSFLFFVRIRGQLNFVVG